VPENACERRHAQDRRSLHVHLLGSDISSLQAKDAEQLTALVAGKVSSEFE